MNARIAHGIGRLAAWSSILALAASGAVACDSSVGEGMAEGAEAQSVGISASEFQETIQQTLAFFSAAISHQGATFQIQADWNDPGLNAGTDRDGAVWRFFFSGGLARLPGMTRDAFTIVTCHELGHELGGYPFAKNDYAAAGGQADYFAAHVCARLLWEPEGETNQTFRDRVPRFEKALCDETWSGIAQQELCYRIMAATKVAAGGRRRHFEGGRCASSSVGRDAGQHSRSIGVSRPSSRSVPA
jgi:hypothetical protein